MKRRDFLSEARRLTEPQLFGKITEQRKQLLELNQQKILGKLKNVAQIRALKRSVARYATILDEKVVTALKENKKIKS